MKKLTLRLAVLGVLVLIPCLCYQASRTGPFRVRVVDVRTGAGVSNALVTVANGAEGTTAFDGSVLFWLDTALMNRTLPFTIAERGLTTTVALPVSAGGVETVLLSTP